jgi:transcriptional regulator of met regulon
MVDFQTLLDALYQIQGASHPNQPAASAKERLDEIFEIASRMMRQSGYQPDDAFADSED